MTAPDDVRARFEAWWKASKYTQVVYAGSGTKQAALDGYRAAHADLSGEVRDSTIRSAKDYAIEHAGYLATAVRDFLHDLGEENAALDQHESNPTDDTLAELEAAQQAVSDARETVRDRLYEFEKRRDFALAKFTQEMMGEKMTPTLDSKLRCLQSLLQQMGASVACKTVGEARDALLTAHLAQPAQAVDGWQPTDDDVQAWRGRHNISLSLYDCRSAIEDARIMHHFDVRPAALPNANGKEDTPDAA